MSILIDKNTKVITQGITGKTGQFHTRMCREYANGRNCFVAGVNPKKAGEDFEGIPIFASVKDAAAKTGATVSVIYVPPAGPRRRSGRRWRPTSTWRSASPRASRSGDMLVVRNKMKRRSRRRQEDAAARPELPGPDHAGRDQDRHHAGPHPPEGPHRRRQPFGHADLRGGGAADRHRPRPEQRGGHRRRPDQRVEAHRHHEALQRRSGHRCGDHDRRDRRPRRGRGRDVARRT